MQGEDKSSKRSIKWSEEADIAFKTLKKEIARITFRTLPDLNKEFILVTDASNIAMGAVLTQKDDSGRERIISCLSRKFIKAQQNYSTTDKELLAIEKGIEYYKHYLLGKHFILKTDHQALQYMQTASNDNSRILRIALKLQNFKFTPVYIKGETNIADIFSRPSEPNSINSFKVLSEEDKIRILQSYHLATGHGSSSNMKFVIAKRYEWTGMMKDIENFTSNCNICCKSGEALVNTKNRIIKSTFPNEIWEIDLIGRIPGNSQSENQYIFVAIDHYTKWIEAKALKSKTSSEICRAIQELIINKHGIPTRILTDPGLEFNNKETKELAQNFNFRWEFSSPRHHETIGAVERANQTLFNILKRLTNFGTAS